MSRREDEKEDAPIDNSPIHTKGEDGVHGNRMSKRTTINKSDLQFLRWTPQVRHGHNQVGIERRASTSSKTTYLRPHSGLGSGIGPKNCSGSSDGVKPYGKSGPFPRLLKVLGGAVKRE